MKHMRKLLALLLALTLVCGLLPAALAAPAAPAEPNAGDVAINATNFPDPIFRSYVSTEFDTNANGYLSESEITAATTASLTGKGISDLKGVEYLTSLITLNCGSNNLTSIDVSKNTHLKTLSLDHNNLTTLNVSGHPDLKTLRIYSNPGLTTVDCSNCALTGLGTHDLPALTKLFCYGNQLTSLDLSQNTALTELDCGINSLASLDVSKNTALTMLDCGYNSLASLDVSKNTALETLYCYDNQLTSLDLSQNTALTVLDCDGNQLTSLNLSKNTALTKLNCQDNQLTSLDVSKNAALETLYCYDNQLTSLDLSKNTALQDLRCSNNQLTSLDLSKNTVLTDLSCYGNQLTSLDLSKNTALTYLSCFGNQLTSLDLSEVPALKDAVENGTKTSRSDYDYYSSSRGQLYVDKTVTIITDTPGLGIAINATNFPDANFRTVVKQYDTNNNGYLIPAELTAVTEMDCSSKSIANLKGVEHFTALSVLSCYTNQLTSLDLSKNTALERLSCYGNQLTSLDLSKNKALTKLNCHSNQLTSLDLSKNTALTYLSCSGNQLTSLDLSQNTALTELYCYGNQLTSLDLSKNTALTRLDCGYTSLSRLDLSKNTALTYLSCIRNHLTSLDLRPVPALNYTVGLYRWKELPPEIPSGFDFVYYQGSQGVLYVDPDVELLVNINPFTDVKEGKFYYEPVLWAYYSDPQVTAGTDATHFSPTKTCTRGQVVTFLWRAKGCPEPTLTENPFTDVKKSAFYYKAVLWAVENGVTTGATPTTFAPGKPCTRGQVVSFLWRAEGSPAPTTTTCPFTDVKTSGFYYEAMLWAVENGVTTGTSPTTFGPGKPCTRGQVVSFLQRAVE